MHMHLMSLSRVQLPEYTWACRRGDNARVAKGSPDQDICAHLCFCFCHIQISSSPSRDSEALVSRLHPQANAGLNQRSPWTEETMHTTCSSNDIDPSNCSIQDIDSCATEANSVGAFRMSFRKANHLFASTSRQLQGRNHFLTR